MTAKSEATIEGLRERVLRMGALAEAIFRGLRCVRNQGEQIEREVPVGVVTRFAREITVARRPAKRVDGRARGIQRRGLGWSCPRRADRSASDDSDSTATKGSGTSVIGRPGRWTTCAGSGRFAGQSGRSQASSRA